MPLSHALERIWYPGAGGRSPPLARALAIPELAFRAGAAVRGALYSRGILPSVRVPGARVISIGNLTAGGAGKTPAVIHLASMLSTAGRRVFVLSRGYGRKSRAPVTFRAADADVPSWEIAGDEPVLIARRCPEVTVMVGADRAALAVEAARRGAEFILLDDGFQHRRLQRDLDIIAVDAAAGFGNGRLLPRGPLREPLSALRRAGLLWLRESDGPAAPLPPMNLPVVRVRLRPAALIDPSGNAQPPESLRGRKVIALAAIARPERFVDTLVSFGAEVVERRLLPDHAPLAPHHLAAQDGALLVTTEKDHARLPPGTAGVAHLRMEIQVVGGDAALRYAVSF